MNPLVLSLQNLHNLIVFAMVEAVWKVHAVYYEPYGNHKELH